MSTERVGGQREAYEATVIELHGNRVLKDITPP